MDDEIEKSIISLYNERKTYKEISFSLSISFSTISKTLNKYEIVRRVVHNKGIKMPDETKEKLSSSLKGNVPWNKGLKVQTFRR